MQSLPPIVICFTFKLRDESFDLELVTRYKFLSYFVKIGKNRSAVEIFEQPRQFVENIAYKDLSKR